TRYRPNVIEEIWAETPDRPIGTSLASSSGMHPEAQRLNALTDSIIGAAVDVHKTLGPGLLESAYEACLYHELVKRGLKVERQKPLPLVYGDVKLDGAYRMDLVIEKSVVIEVKAVAGLGAVHS